MSKPAINRLDECIGMCSMPYLINNFKRERHFVSMLNTDTD